MKTVVLPPQARPDRPATDAAWGDVTVVMPTSNAGDGLLLAVKSLREYAGYPFRLRVYDHETGDGSVERLKKEEPWVEIMDYRALSPEERMHAGVMQSETRWTLIIHTDLEFIDYGIVWDSVRLAHHFDRVAALGGYRPPYYLDDKVHSGGMWNSFMLIDTRTYQELDAKHACFAGQPDGGTLRSTESRVQGVPVEVFGIRFAHVLQYCGYAYLELPDYVTCKMIHYNSSARDSRYLKDRPGKPIVAYEHTRGADRGPNRRSWQVLRAGLISRRLELLPARDRPHRPHVVWGVGEDAIECAARLRYEGIEPLAFVEESPHLWGSIVEGKEVWDSGRIFDIENVFVCVSVPDYEDKARFLLEAGLRYIDDFTIFRIRGHDYHVVDDYVFVPGKGNTIAFSMIDPARTYTNVSTDYRYIQPSRIRREDAALYAIRKNEYIRQIGVLDRVFHLPWFRKRESWLARLIRLFIRR